MKINLTFYYDSTGSQVEIYQIKNYIIRNNIPVRMASFMNGIDATLEVSKWLNVTCQTDLIQKNTTVSSPFNTIYLTYQLLNDTNTTKIYLAIGKNEIMEVLNSIYN